MASSSSNTGPASGSHGRRLSWPPEPIPPVGYLSRKALPIKRNDAEMLTREDIQFNLLEHIFSNTQAVFTPAPPAKPDQKVTFRDLYTTALYNSNKCSKVVKEKMIETPAFGLELAKISLLTNVGRINTTMAFFPEMKTALRTYHPVPSLQKTDGNAQDAPRIKNCLKAALLPSEFKSLPPSTPDEVLEKLRAGHHPPTSVVNLIFVLATHAAPLAAIHFDGTFNFLDLFIPKALSSLDRARTFLWLIYHYLESPESPNPFDDNHSRSHPGKAPFLRPLSDAEMAKENVDTREEIEWGKRMSGQRNIFLHKLVSSLEDEKKSKAAAPHFVPEPQSATQPSSSRTRPQRRGYEPAREETGFMYYVPGEERSPAGSSSATTHPTTPADEPSHSAPSESGRERSMLNQAWHTIKNTDPLLDSDEEHPDEHNRVEYARRLDTLNRLYPSGDMLDYDRASSQHPVASSRW
ncbi:hypothetical protein Moror_147 [Moniliophthora roreri MCA 2997]|uniref:Ino eighty subunit 1 n=1 Tax=Moniliophthora roreri (strain MCA 2997) TaxID=1381753 RepID=V2XXA3_MONRO|nr:hypothetical protein Moror_147 [Moniliophthora roreri MCA 2997]